MEKRLRNEENIKRVIENEMNVEKKLKEVEKGWEDYFK